MGGFSGQFFFIFFLNHYNCYYYLHRVAMCDLEYDVENTFHLT